MHKKYSRILVLAKFPLINTTIHAFTRIFRLAYTVIKQIYREGVGDQDSPWKFKFLKLT